MKARIHRAAMRVTLLATAAVLAACGGLKSEAEAERLYVLNAAAETQGPAMAGVLIVPRPAVQPGLDTHRIALTRADNELDYYALSRWTGTLPEVLAAFVIQSLDGSFTTVTSGARSAGAADYELLLTAQRFEAEYGDGDGAPTVHVRFECVLVDTSPRRVLGGCDGEAREPAADNRMGAIVAAFERAAQGAMQQVRQKALQAAANSPAGTAPASTPAGQ